MWQSDEDAPGHLELRLGERCRLVESSGADGKPSANSRHGWSGADCLVRNVPAVKSLGSQ